MSQEAIGSTERVDAETQYPLGLRPIATWSGGAQGSLVVGLLTCLAFGLVLLAARFLFPAEITLSITLLALLASLCGLIVAMLWWLVLGRELDQQPRRLAQQIQSDRSAIGPLAFISRFDAWLTPIRQAVQRTVGPLARRVDQVQAQCRELEIQVRVADAERKHIEGIVQSISDAVIVTDAFNEVALANQTAGEALRFDPAQAKHQPVEQIFHDAVLVRLIKDTRESGNVTNRRQAELQIGDANRMRTFHVTLSCVPNAQGEVAGVVTILHDITREREISEMKSDFVSSVSHELRTPLSSIKAYVEMLVDGEANDEQTRAEFYNIIQSETNRLSRLIDNILNISRIESGIVKVQRETIALNQVVEEVIDVIQPQARAKRIIIKHHPDPAAHQVYADRDMIYQALLNLLSNAVKYTLDDGEVVIDMAVHEQDRTVTIAVSDTGVGIPDDALPHLFKKFYRVSDHKNLAKGTGLGLNLVKHIVETVHGGSVRVDSQQGTGSTFRVSLPILASAPG